MAAMNECLSCKRDRGPGRFCQFCGVFALDPEGTVVMASRLSRLGAAIVNVVLMFLTLFIGWVIWWFIVAPRGQNPGKAVVGLRVIKTNGEAATTGTMFVRGLVGLVLGNAIPIPIDSAWLLWDRDAQTLHDKLVDTVVVKAQGSERIVEQGSLGAPPPGVEMPPAYAPPVTMPSTAPPPASSPPSGVPQAEGGVEAELVRLASLREQELITQQEYEEKRKAVLDRM
ncbi:MAG: RDD family protein [Dehalococcoidia bacterium]